MKLSIVIPTYNEEKRLPRTLDRISDFLSKHLKESYEIIVVDDGSRDKTAAIVNGYRAKDRHLRLLEQSRNQGRGAAVRRGVLAAQGDFVLETDADGSVDDEAISRFLKFFEENSSVDVAIGSRNLEGAKILTPQPWLRVFLGYGFLYLAKLLFGWDIADYTLGFKMFRRDAAQDIFHYQFDDRYIAEVEIIFAARKRGWRLKELPVAWTDFRDSRVKPFRDSFRSLRGVFGILARNFKGRYAK